MQLCCYYIWILRWNERSKRKKEKETFSITRHERKLDRAEPKENGLHFPSKKRILIDRGIAIIAIGDNDLVKGVVPSKLVLT